MPVWLQGLFQTAGKGDIITEVSPPSRFPRRENLLSGRKYLGNPGIPARDSGFGQNSQVNRLQEPGEQENRLMSLVPSNPPKNQLMSLVPSKNPQENRSGAFWIWFLGNFVGTRPPGCFSWGFLHGIRLLKPIFVGIMLGTRVLEHISWEFWLGTTRLPEPIFLGIRLQKHVFKGILPDKSLSCRFSWRFCWVPVSWAYFVVDFV